MRELVTKNTYLIDDFGAQFHCLLVSYFFYLFLVVINSVLKLVHQINKANIIIGNVCCLFPRI